ncbi:MAG: ABC transporter permease [Candidatus Bathyarchaeia archaeon]
MLIFFTTVIIAKSFCYHQENALFSDLCYNQVSELRNILQNLNLENIKSHVRVFSQMKSRVTGYPGFYDAADYIKSKLVEYNINVEIHRYVVAVPLDAESYIEFGGKIIKAGALWPNGIQTSATPTHGIKGRAVYVGRGRLEDFNGYNVNGSIVIMDFNSGDNWLNAARLGAKAVIFIESPYSNFFESKQKFLNAPLYFPRLYVNQGDGIELLDYVNNNPDAEVKIMSRVEWKNVEGINILGIINGSAVNSGSIIISSHFDSLSVVPSVSPAAHEAISPAFLLELARYFSENKPRISICILFLSGHWQALAGIREFIEDYFFNSTNFERIKPTLFINIGELYPQASSLSIMVRSHLTTSVPPSILLSPIQNFFTSLAGVKELNDYLLNTVNLTTTEFIRSEFLYAREVEQQPYILESEPVIMTGCPAFSIESAFTYKTWWWTPIDDFNFIDFEALKPKLVVSAFIISSIAASDSFLNVISPQRFKILGPGQYLGFITLFGRVVEFNREVGWYTNVPEAVVTLEVSTNTFAFSKITVIADEKGYFVIHGVLPTPSFDAITGRRYKLEAWRINKETGLLEYAPDLGIYGSQQLPFIYEVYEHPKEVTIVVSKMLPVTVFDPIDPTRLRMPVLLDPSFPYRRWVAEMGMFQPMDFRGKSQMLVFGSYYNGYEPVALAFVPSESVISLIMLPPVQAKTKWPFMVCVNASEDYPEGYGIFVNGPVTVYFSPYYFARDLYYITVSRYQTLANRQVRSPTAERWIEEAKQHLERSFELYKMKVYDRAYGEALIAYSIIYRAYSMEVMPLVEDSSMSALFFFSVFIIGALAVERLFFNLEKGRLRLFATIVITSIFVALFNIIHPALAIMQNSSMGLIGITILMILLIVVFVISSESEKIIKRIAVERLGRHEVRISPLELVTSVAPSVAIHHMRKRRLRTALGLIILIAAVVAMTSLSSTSSYTVTRFSIMQTPSDFSGLIIKNGYGSPSWGGHFDYQIVYALKVLAGENYSVCPRIWYYPQAIAPMGNVLTLRSKNSSVNVVAALGLTVEELNLFLQKYLYKGRPFLEEETNAVILPKSLAEVLGVDVGQYIEMFGYRLVVVGTLHDQVAEGIMYPDGFKITPFDPLGDSLLTRGVISIPQFSPQSLSWRSCIIVPHKLAKDLGGYIGAIAILPKISGNIEELSEISRSISESFISSVYIGWEGKSYVSSTFKSFITLGWSEVMLLLIVVCLSIFTHIIGSINERLREIDIFSVIGLSPIGVSTIFLVESAIYALIGIMFGYFLGLFMNVTFLNMGLLPKDFVFNFSSTSMLLSLASIMLAALAGTIYPSLVVAGKRVTPSLMRRWKMALRPSGDLWEIPLMIRLSAREEVFGILAFLEEYYRGMGAESKFFTVSYVEPVDSKEMILKMKVHLAPYELGIIQEVKVIGIELQKNYTLNALITRLSGSPEIWEKRNYQFIDSLRKQALLWRVLPLQEREKYMKKFTR